ncbi:membrane protease subunit, stomatin/prohibitin [Herbaspirillum sp. CF444]|uniref:prohibitin family protein n=1 Tax=Herbaspirillum sp. CF444 TaxID=1144319 RepID=UPI00027262D7|nr:prohibitin family protein [Herbaspirillum sp. CF444]EJL94060.1 membrane protease subunit, stomatin/prohibitin [Herbaspirillum sp. CF444]
MSTTHEFQPSFESVRERLRRRLRFFSNDLMIAGLVLVVMLVFLLPSMIVTIPAGHLGVLWKRFAGGTVIDHVEKEGTHLMLPWDVMYVYDARLQSVEREFEVLSSDGLKLMVTLAWRFRVIPQYLGELHKYAGPEYAETLLGQSVGARARDVIAIYRPEDIYTSHRLEIQNQISESVRYDIKNRFNTELRSGQNWILIEDVLVKRIVLPDGVEDAIVRKNVARHEVEQYALIVEKEQQESERKRVEALGIRNFQEIISGGMSDAYLRWRGIEATLELARSENAKVVVIGNDKTGGMPLISINGDSVPHEKKDAKDKAVAPQADIGKGDTTQELKSGTRGKKSVAPGPMPAPAEKTSSAKPDVAAGKPVALAPDLQAREMHRKEQRALRDHPPVPSVPSVPPVPPQR